jgi:hypothetical protein
MKLSHKFVKNIPDAIECAVLYISWKLTFDGKTISLYPSIGNWSLRCQSHYWITNSEVEWAPKWSRERIERGRKEEKRDKETYYKKENPKSLFGFFFKK